MKKITLLASFLLLNISLAHADLYSVCVQPIINEEGEPVKVVLAGPLVAKAGTDNVDDLSEQEFDAFQASKIEVLKKYAKDKKLLKGKLQFDEEEAECSDVDPSLDTMNEALKAYIQMFEEMDVKVFKM